MFLLRLFVALALVASSTQQANEISVQFLSEYAVNDDFASVDNSTDDCKLFWKNYKLSSTNLALNEYPFTTRMFPIETYSDLSSNIKLESDDKEAPRQHPPRAYNPRPVYVNAGQASQPIPLTEQSSSDEHYHRGSNELLEEHYNFGSYDFVRRHNNHEYRHRSKENSEKLNEVSSAECPNLPRIIRLNEAPTVQTAPWMPLNDISGDIIQQNWWIERADPSNNDTIVAYGQMRRHKI
jgi:hypothetical protein